MGSSLCRCRVGGFKPGPNPEPAITHRPRLAFTAQSTSRDLLPFLLRAPQLGCTPHEVLASADQLMAPRPKQPGCWGSRVRRSPASAAPCTALRPCTPSPACAGEMAGKPVGLRTEQDPRSSVRPSVRDSGAPACNENGALDLRLLDLHSHRPLERTWAGGPGTL